jgi:hypothetical protein
MKIAMYKGPPTHFLHKVGHAVINFWTGSDYSHCELVFGQPNMHGSSLCASSSARDGGVRFKWINLKDGKWDVYDLPGFDEKTAKAWFYDRQGLKYDYLGLLWFVLPIRKFNNPRRWFCSEAIGAALGLDRPHKLHPEKLFIKLVS